MARDSRDLRNLLQPRYRFLKHTTIIPRGDRGFLRVANSAKLNAVLGHVLGDAAIERFKERAGLGYTLLTLGTGAATKHRSMRRSRLLAWRGWGPRAH